MVVGSEVVQIWAYFKMSGFTHIEFWPFLGLLIFSMLLHHNEFLPFLGPPPSPLTFHNVKNHGGGGADQEELPGTKNKENNT